MPSRQECEELLQNTNYSWTTVNGVTGAKFINKSDSSKYIFFPAAGYYYNGTYVGEGNECTIWTTSYDSGVGKPCYLSLEGANSHSVACVKPSCGFSIRAVHDPF